MRSGLRLFVALLILTTSCARTPATAARDLPPVTVVATANDEITVNVLEVMCQSCAAHILAGCREIPGVASVDIDRKAKLITLHFDSSLTSRDRILAAVDEVVSTIP